jgi:hypothetical protein
MNLNHGGILVLKQELGNEPFMSLWLTQNHGMYWWHRLSSLCNHHFQSRNGWATIETIVGA